MGTKLGWLFCGLLGVLPLSSTGATIYLVRHAEKRQVGVDPALTACGLARANALAADLAEVKLAAVFATPYQRTQQTAAAVAHSQQLKVSLYDPRDTEALLQQLNQQNQPVLIVGHSNTVPQLVTQLSGIAMAPLTEQDFDMLYQVDTASGSNTLKRVTLTRQAFHCAAE
ncbi:MAG TPA: phosphoglycerate mutase family protein [Rheinheimera sp.]|nr:phosphoglycerate mutase family protein [Rheinheimera sp.]